MNAAKALLTTLLQAGVDACFSNPGTPEMHFVAALDRAPGMCSVFVLYLFEAPPPERQALCAWHKTLRRHDYTLGPTSPSACQSRRRAVQPAVPSSNDCTQATAI